MKTPAKQPNAKNEGTDAGKAHNTPQASLLLEIAHIRDEVQKKRTGIEDDLQAVRKAADAKRAEEEKFFANIRNKGGIFAARLLKAEGDKPGNSKLELCFKDFAADVSSLCEYVKAMGRAFEELGARHDEEHAIIMKDHGKGYVTSHPGGSGLHFTRRLDKDEMKKRDTREEKKCAELDGETALKARVYQNHMLGFAETAIRLTVDGKKCDRYLELLKVVTDLLATNNLQKFHKFDGIEYVVENMVRLIGEFRKGILDAEQNPEKLGAIQAILGEIHRRLEAL